MASASSHFFSSAVDLDAVLDQFEEKESEKEKQKEELIKQEEKRETKEEDVEASSAAAPLDPGPGPEAENGVGNGDGEDLIKVNGSTLEEALLKEEKEEEENDKEVVKEYVEEEAPEVEEEREEEEVIEDVKEEPSLPPTPPPSASAPEPLTEENAAASTSSDVVPPPQPPESPPFQSIYDNGDGDDPSAATGSEERPLDPPPTAARTGARPKTPSAQQSTTTTPADQLDDDPAREIVNNPVIDLEPDDDDLSIMETKELLAAKEGDDDDVACAPSGELEKLKLPVSPPPYAEVDPVGGGNGDVASPQLQPARPTDLALEETLAPQQQPPPPLQRTDDSSLNANDSDDTQPQPPSAPTVDEPVPAAAAAAVAAASGAVGGHDGADADATDAATHLVLGEYSPHWIPDVEAPSCQLCDSKFTLMRRRHHCRACGKVLCGTCCGEKFPLKYMEGKVARVCLPCKSVLESIEQQGASSSSASSSSSRRPNPNNPMDYCSTVSPLAQTQGATPTPPASVMVPVGVLKKAGTPASSTGTPGGVASGSGDAVDGAAAAVAAAEAKSVMFSDGIRPGGDLTELDGSDGGGGGSGSRLFRRQRKKGRKGSANGSSSAANAAGTFKTPKVDLGRSLLPGDADAADALPLVHNRGEVEAAEVTRMLTQDGVTVPFVVNKHLRVHVKLVHYSPIDKEVWNYRTDGLTSVGQDEVVFLLVRANDEEVLPPTDLFRHFQALYQQAKTGSPVTNMGYTTILSGSCFLSSSDRYGGFLFLRHTFQSVDRLDLPPPTVSASESVSVPSSSPFLFAVLLSKWEMPWARVFPLRLLLRLGAEARYYPCPLWSDRDRPTVYKDIGNTIMNLLSDFRNYTYTLPIISGLHVHMEDNRTRVLLPKLYYRQVQRALLNSNDPVLALGANFSTRADSHLVAVQASDGGDQPARAAAGGAGGGDYETQAINIVNKSRKVTAASFLVLNGALRPSSGLTAKSSIVEDGIMVQVAQDKMKAIRKALEKMEGMEIECGPIDAEQPDEIVAIEWTDDDEPPINAGVLSLIDGSSLAGKSSIRLHSGRDYLSSDEKYIIRWTEVFLLSAGAGAGADFDPPDPITAANCLAKAICQGLVPHLGQLRQAAEAGGVAGGVAVDVVDTLAVRVTLDPENVGYVAGCRGRQLSQKYMNLLDDILIPVVHGGSEMSAVGSSSSSLELVFHILPTA